MLFIWGTKRVERKVGAVAEFCPLCRSIGAFDLVRIGMAGHVYYTLVQLGLGPRRYVRTQILPQLAHALRPLRPNRHELVDCVEKFKTNNYAIGKRVTVAQLWEEMARMGK